ncbi:MAG: enoyl-CoA hydratase-related protein, partial [Myxococcota bacterium]|nr:enoyl-CoA hydratase-related protein [Myxococcota bacterium]
MSQQLRYQKNDQGLGVLTLHRPDVLNAISWELLCALRDQVAVCAADSSLRVLVITGAGHRGFCAGADLKERREYSEERFAEFVQGIGALMAEVGRLPMPTIAAINGHAFGGGCELALSCDLRTMSEGFKIGLTELALAIIPGAGGTQRLPRLLGPAKAKELIFTAARLSAEEALRYGLVNRVGASALEEAERLASDMLKCGPLALRAAKQAIDDGGDVGLDEGLAIEQACYQTIIPTEDRL